MVVVVTVFLYWITDQNLAFAGTKELKYSFGEPSSFVGIWTSTRPSGYEEVNGQKIGIIKREKTYLDLKTPVTFEEATISLTFQNLATTDLYLALEEDTLDNKKQFKIEPLIFKEKRGDWTVGEAKFSLKKASRVNNKYVLFIYAPGLKSGGDIENDNVNTGLIKVANIEAEFTKSPFGMGDLKRIIAKIKP